MKTRVTITLDPEVHRLAKQKARRKHTTVSGLIESLLQSATSTKDDDWVAGMMGITSLRDSVSGADPAVRRSDRQIYPVMKVFLDKEIEDACQAAAAFARGADLIVTRNISGFKHSPMLAISPAEFLKQL